MKHPPYTLSPRFSSVIDAIIIMIDTAMQYHGTKKLSIFGSESGPANDERHI